MAGGNRKRVGDSWRADHTLDPEELRARIGAALARGERLSTFYCEDCQGRGLRKHLAAHRLSPKCAAARRARELGRRGLVRCESRLVFLPEAQPHTLPALTMITEEGGISREVWAPPWVGELLGAPLPIEVKRELLARPEPRRLGVILVAAAAGLDGADAFELAGVPRPRSFPFADAVDRAGKHLAAAGREAARAMADLLDSGRQAKRALAEMEYAALSQFGEDEIRRGLRKDRQANDREARDRRIPTKGGVQRAPWHRKR